MSADNAFRPETFERVRRRRRLLVAAVMLVGVGVVGLGLAAAAPAAARGLGLTDMRMASREWAKRSSAKQAGQEAVREAERNIERYGDDDDDPFRRGGISLRDDDDRGKLDDDRPRRDDAAMGAVLAPVELRVGPGETSQVLGTLSVGDRVLVLEQRGDAVRVLVSTDDGALVGWIPRRKVDIR